MKIMVIGSSTMLGRALLRRLGTDAINDDWGLDLHSAGAVGHYLAMTRPDAVIVAAGRTAGIEGNIKSPADLMTDNLLIAAHVIPAAYRHRVGKLLYVASSCIYPRFTLQPMTVEALWTGPLEPTSSAYATAKLAGLRLCQAFRQQHQVAFNTAIVGDVFGPGDDYDPMGSHVVAALIRKMHEAKLTDLPIVSVWGTGRPRREFIYVDDVADALAFLLERYDDDVPINVGTGLTTSIRDVAELIQKVVGYEGGLMFSAYGQDGMPLKGLNTKPLRAMGWTPKHDLETGLRKTYREYANLLDSTTIETKP